MSSRRILSALVTALLLAASFAAAEEPVQRFAPVQGGFTTQGEEVLPYAPDRVLIKLSPQRAKAANSAPMHRGAMLPTAQFGLPNVDALLARAGARRVERPFVFPRRMEKARSDHADWYMVHVDRGDMEALAAELKQLPEVVAASPDWRAFPMATPNDPLFPDNWGHNNTAQLPDLDWGGTYEHTLPTTVGTPGFDTNAQPAWDASQGYGSSGIVIAILDSGVDQGHPDLNQVAGYDYGDNDSNPDDDSAQAGHGTACAGVAAAIANNGLGAVGIAGGCSIMPLKVANSAGSMYFSSLTNAVYHAADNGADMISMSLGAAITSDPGMDAALQYAYNAGCTIFAATGNENDNTISYPAINAYVVGVGAASPCGDRKRSSSLSSECNPGVNTDPNGYTCDGERWWGSNYGVNSADAAGAVDVLAPTILPTTDIQGSGGYDPGDYDGFFNGTSCSTPYAAGVAALVKSQNPGWTPAQIRDRLCDTAIDIVNVESGSGWDRYSGYGMVDAEAAVGGGGPVEDPPVAAFTASPTSGLMPLAVSFTDQSTNSPTSWAWDFGDGGTSTAQNPDHTYDAAGSYTVTLTATNPYGSDDEIKTDHITVTDPADTYASLPYATGFEEGAVDQYWSLTEGTEGRIRVTSSYTPRGGFHLVMDDYNNGGSYSLNEAWLQLNLAGESQVDLDFWWKDFSDETHSQDGVYFSDDGGASFVKVQDLNGGSYSNNTWYEFNLDLDALASGAGLSLTNQFVVKFQQYDNYSATTDGMAFDDISVTGGAVVDPPVAAFSGTPTSGDYPLAVQFTDASTNNPTAWSWDFGDGGNSNAQNPSHTYNAAGTYTVTLTATNAGGSDDEVKTDYITVTEPATGGVIGEVDLITRDQSAGQWYGVTLDNTYTDPVVVMKVLGFNGGHPTHLRVRNATATGFEWQMEEWEYKDGNHTTEDCPYIVVEAGVHTLEDGTVIEAGTRDVGTGFASVSLTHAFSSPVLLTGVMSQNDPTPIVTRTRNLTGGGFQIKVQEEEANDNVHATETVAWIVIEAGSGTNGGADFLAGRTPNAVTDAWYTIDLSPAFGSTPIFLAHDDTYDGGNTSGLRYRNLGTSSVEVFCEEEQSADSETSHITEAVSYLAWGAAGDLVALGGADEPIAWSDPDPIDEKQLPHVFSVPQNYPNPFNPTTTIRFDLPVESRVQVEVFNVRGAKVATLADRRYGAGVQNVVWNARGVASGIYFYRVRTDTDEVIRKMTLLK